MRRFLLSILFCSIWTMTAIAQVNLSWMKVNMGSAVGWTDEAFAVCLDKSGNVYTTGYVNNTTTLQDIFTMKRTAAGDSVWARTYTTGGGGYDQPFSMVLDDSGCVVIGGEVGGRFSVIKYGTNGDFRWIKTIGTSGSAQSVCVDSGRNIYAAGVVSGTGDDIQIVKLSPLGDSLWYYKYNGTGNGSDRSHGIAVDRNQNCFVVGESAGGATNTDIVTIKILSNGSFGWAQRYNGTSNGHDYGYAIGVDTNSNVYVCGEAYVLNYGQDACLISYTGSGSQRYAKTFNGSSNYDDLFQALTIDASQNIYVTGKIGLSGTGSSTFYTMKLLPNVTGDTLWARQYTIPDTYYNSPHAIAVSAAGKVYVTGEVYVSNVDVGTLCYSSAGSVLWSMRYDGPGSDNELGYSVAVNGSGTVYVAGSSVGSSSYLDYTLFAYQETGTGINEIHTSPQEFTLSQNYPNPFNPSTTLDFSLPKRAIVRLTIFNLLGEQIAKLVDGDKNAGAHHIFWDARNYPSGTYFCRLQVGNFVETKKILLLK